MFIPGAVGLGTMKRLSKAGKVSDKYISVFHGSTDKNILSILKKNAFKLPKQGTKTFFAFNEKVAELFGLSKAALKNTKQYGVIETKISKKTIQELEENGLAQATFHKQNGIYLELTRKGTKALNDLAKQGNEVKHTLRKLFKIGE